MQEVERKVQRLARVAGEAGLRGVLLSTHWNFSWLTAGASNRIDISREAGAGSLLVAASGRRYVLANAIEMPRLGAEALAGLGFEPVEFPWVDERADPAFVVRRATEVLGGGPLGADIPSGGTRAFESHLTRLRTALDPEELARYRVLGADVGRSAGSVLQSVPSGVSERTSSAKSRSRWRAQARGRLCSWPPVTTACCGIAIRFFPLSSGAID